MKRRSLLGRIHAALRAFKASATAPLLVAGQAGQAVWTENKYEDLAEEGYQKNVIAYRCIADIAMNAASVPWKLWSRKRRTQDDWEEEMGSPLLDLIKRPNELQGRSAFIEEHLSFFQIDGNAYMEGAGPLTGDKAGSFKYLYTKRPDRMQIIKGPLGVGGYKWQFNAGEHTWSMDPLTGQCNIRHFKFFNPLDDWYGMSPISAAARDVDIHNQYGVWNYNLLHNQARPGAIITFNEGLTDEQYDRLRKDLEDREGPDKVGKSLILEGAARAAQYGFSPQDMEFITGRNTTARDIANAFKYPPILLNIAGDSTFSNMKEARLWLWETTIVWYLNLLRDEWNVWLVPRFYPLDGPGEYKLDYDLSATPIAASKETVGMERQEKLKGIGSINERRAEVGLDDLGAIGDVILVPSGEIPLEMVGLMDEEEDEVEEEEDTQEGEAQEEEDTEEEDTEEEGGNGEAEDEDDEDEEGAKAARLFAAMIRSARGRRRRLKPAMKHRRR